MIVSRAELYRSTGRFILGFTGTRYGMTAAQYDQLYGLLRHRQPDEFHHGDGGLSDAAAHMLVCRLYRNYGTFSARLVLHPSTLVRWRAWCWPYDRIHTPALPLERDRDIAREITHLYAAPGEFARKPHSGTWATIGYAREEDVNVTIIYPDGSLG